jgi:integrase/recombinase XerD
MILLRGWGCKMLTVDIERYISTRQLLGCKFMRAKSELLAFGKIAAARGDDCITKDAVLAWADLAPTAYSRSTRLKRVAALSRFLNVENNIHFVPNPLLSKFVYRRPLPYIYQESEIRSILLATDNLQKNYPLRKAVYKTMLGLIASTGLRASEALNLKFEHIRPDGTLLIKGTKFDKDRYVPLHPTVWEALQMYILERQKSFPSCDHVFVSRHGKNIAPTTLNYNFRVILTHSNIEPRLQKQPRIHDLRHTFATRTLERCATDRQSITKEFVALSTYLGHSDIRATYWYLSATPDLMDSIVSSVENFLSLGGSQ